MSITEQIKHLEAKIKEFREKAGLVKTINGQTFYENMPLCDLDCSEKWAAYGRMRYVEDLLTNLKKNMSKIITISHQNNLVFSASSERVAYATSHNGRFVVHFRDGGSKTFDHPDAEQVARDINSIVNSK